jgi:MerR family regulatory protein
MKSLGIPSFSIGEAAERSGFAAATLRYYDELGLVIDALFGVAA